jgi:hypothetical protein
MLIYKKGGKKHGVFLWGDGAWLLFLQLAKTLNDFIPQQEVCFQCSHLQKTHFVGPYGKNLAHMLCLSFACK